MPGVDLQITGGTGARDARGRFRSGFSGNPAGRPVGSVNRATRAAALLLDGEAEALTRKAIAMALDGDPVALRLCLDRILGVRRGRPVALALPPLDDAETLGAAAASVGAAAAGGDVTPEEGLALAQMLKSVGRNFDASHAARKRRWRGALWRAWARKSRGRIAVPW
jgi:Family of unknown function (DUF5681)